MFGLEGKLTINQINKLLSLSREDTLISKGFSFKFAMYIKLIKQYTGIDLKYTLVNGAHLIQLYRWLNTERDRIWRVNTIV